MKLYAIIGKFRESWYAYGITENLELAKKLLSEKDMYSGGEYKLYELREILLPEKAH